MRRNTMVRMARGIASAGRRASPPGDGPDLDSHIARHGKRERQPHAAKAVGKETSVGSEIPKTKRGPGSQSGDQRDGDHNKNNDRDDLDQREPIFELSKISDMRGINADDYRGNHRDPDPLRHIGKPILKINGHGGDFRADGDDLNQAVSGANREARPAIEVALSVNAE